MSRTIVDVKKDRLRFTKNKLSSTLALLAIAFDALYFVSIYSSDVGNYFYTVIIGASVVYNLLFLLCVFLCSEGVKGYKLGYSWFLVAIGVLQIARIFYIPLSAHSTEVSVGVKTVLAMGDAQFIRVVIYLSLSAIACIAGGLIGVHKSVTLKNYEQSLEGEQ